MKIRTLVNRGGERERVLGQLHGDDFDIDPWPHLARLETEHDNLQAALAWALGSDDADVFVRLAVAQGWPERAARLLGTAAAWFDARGTIIGQTEQAEYDASIAACVHLGDAVFAVAWAVGQAIPLEQMLAQVIAARS